jgi:hypothetical protein
MTKNEAIEFIKNTVNSEGDTVGFMVVAVTENNIMENLPHLSDRFNKLKKSGKKDVLNQVSDVLTDLYCEFNYEDDLVNSADVEDFIYQNEFDEEE